MRPAVLCVVSCDQIEPAAQQFRPVAGQGESQSDPAPSTRLRVAPAAERLEDFPRVGKVDPRPGRSAPQALDALGQQTLRSGGGWILEVDIRKFLDTLEHAPLREFLQRRVRDGVRLRRIGQGLNAGVLEEGCLSYPETGSPQGGVASPLLANVDLHYVLDEGFTQEVQPRLRGRTFLIRYADDFVIGFTHEEEGRRVLEVLPKRFGK